MAIGSIAVGGKILNPPTGVKYQSPEYNTWVSEQMAAAGGKSGVPYSDTAAGVNSFMTGQAVAPYLANLPNYANMVGQRSENIGQQLEGELPQDVLNQIMQQGAERGIMTGASGSSNSNSAMLRALGLNSLQMQQQGSAGLTQAIADTPVPELWNPMSLQVPMMLGQQEQAAAIAGQNNAASLAKSAAASAAASASGANNSWNSDSKMYADGWKKSGTGHWYKGQWSVN